MTGLAPCRRPRVLVDLCGSERWQADCYVKGCRWRYGNVVKSDVEWQAINHRAAHRAAVPKTEILKFDSGVFQASCSCGWYRESPGVHTRRDNQAALDFHLTYEHGLVES